MNIAVIQMNSTDRPGENLVKAISFLKEASRNKADVIVLPEYSNYMGPLSSAYRMGEEENGPWIASLSPLCRWIGWSRRMTLRAETS